MITLKQLQIYFTPNKKLRSEIVNDIVNDLNKRLFNSGLTNEEIAFVLVSMKEDGRHELKRRSDILNAEIQKTIIAINKL
jgi:hypothetical protein